MLFSKVMYFYICWLVCVGGQVWVLICLLMQCQREVQVGVVVGPAHILHPQGPRSSSTHQSGTALSSWHRWSRCQSSQWHQMTATLPWGSHQCLVHALCTSGLPPKINSSLWCSSSTHTATYNHPCFSQVLWGRTNGKKNKENDFIKCFRSPYSSPCKMPCFLRCQPVINRGREGKPRLCPTKSRVGWINHDQNFGEFLKHRRMLCFGEKFLQSYFFHVHLVLGCFFKNQYCPLFSFLKRWTQNKYRLTLPSSLYFGVSMFCSSIPTATCK